MKKVWSSWTYFFIFLSVRAEMNRVVNGIVSLQDVPVDLSWNFDASLLQPWLLWPPAGASRSSSTCSSSPRSLPWRRRVPQRLRSRRRVTLDSIRVPPSTPGWRWTRPRRRRKLGRFARSATVSWPAAQRLSDQASFHFHHSTTSTSTSGFW